MKDIKYNKEVLQAIESISDSLSKQFIIRKIDGNISIKKNEQSLAMFVDFVSPVENFDFDGDVLAFAENVFTDFYKYFSLFKNPILSQENKKLIIKEDKQVIKFTPSNPEIIPNELKNVKPFPKSSVEFEMTSERFSYIKKMIKMIDCQELSMVANGKVLNISLDNSINGNGCDLDIELNETIEKEIKFKLPITIFSVAPKFDYVVKVVPELKTVLFQSVNEFFTLNIYTGYKV